MAGGGTLATPASSRPRRTRTASETIRFALSGDQDARPAPGETTPYWNNFEVWKAIKPQRNDFNVLVGDTIYSDTEVPGYGLGDVALTMQQKWDAYKLNLGLKPWAKARGSASYYAHWDDHEFINDFSRVENSFPLSVGDVNISGEQLYQRGVKAFRDYNPVTYSKQTGIYRSVRWGKNLEVFFLDERSFRSASVRLPGHLRQPARQRRPRPRPDRPAERPQRFLRDRAAARQPGAAGVHGGDQRPEPHHARRRASWTSSSERSRNSTATFKVIFNEVPIQQYYALPYDRWEGYEAERQELLSYLQQNVDNVVFLTTDVHANLVNDARFNTLGAGGVQNSGILDVTTGPIATANYALEIEDTIDNPAAGALVHDAFFKPQPPSGVGMQCAAMDQYSYAQVEVTKSRLTVDLLDAEDAPVLDTGDVAAGGAQPCAQVVIPKQ